MNTPWGDLPVADAHVHFFSQHFFSVLASEKATDVESLGKALAWTLPDKDPGVLAGTWVQELDRHGVTSAAIIGSVHGDAGSVMKAAAKFPKRFRAYSMVNPLVPGEPDLVKAALATGHLHGLCFFPAMHRYSLHSDEAIALIDLAASHPGTIVFVHCGALSVGVRKKLGLGSPFDMRFSNPIDLHSIALQYPEVRFVVPHFGAGYFREALMLCDLCPNVYLDTSSSNKWMRYEELELRVGFRRALEVAGAHRLLFGTDSSSYPRGWNKAIFDEQVVVLYELGLEAEQAQFILHDNLVQLFV
jgi:predicted TIM-barrel fold metal-dependent hydrolase